MSKAVLIMNMPEDCAACKFLSVYEECYATGANQTLSGYLLGRKPEWCPLRELPEKKESDPVMEHDIDFGMAEGWNACIDAITGEREGKE